MEKKTTSKSKNEKKRSDAKGDATRRKKERGWEQSKREGEKI